MTHRLEKTRLKGVKSAMMVLVLVEDCDVVIRLEVTINWRNFDITV